MQSSATATVALDHRLIARYKSNPAEKHIKNEFQI